MWTDLRSLCQRLSYKTTTRDNKKVLFTKIKTHMIKQRIWSGKIELESKRVKRKRNKRKREDKEVEVDLVTGKLITKFSKQSKKKRIKLQKMHEAKIDLKSKEVATAKKIKRKRVKKSKVTAEVKCKPKKKKQKKGVLIFCSSEDEDFPTTEKGLANAGNTCYINSIVQCLLHCKLFRDGIAIIPEFVLSNDVVRTLKKLFEKMTEYNVRKFIKPRAFLNAVKDIQSCIDMDFGQNGEQEDASEFLDYLLAHIDSVYPLPASIYNIYLISTRTCQNCHISSASRESIRFLTLPIPAIHHDETHDLLTLMQSWTETQVINDYDCSSIDCVERTVGHNKLQVSHYPVILTINLLRFRLGEKIPDKVRFVQNLCLRDIPNSVHPDIEYRLISMVVHRGQRLDSGHYVSYFKQGNEWKEGDDRNITTVTWPRVKEKQAFLLFYEKV